MHKKVRSFIKKLIISSKMVSPGEPSVLEADLTSNDIRKTVELNVKMVVCLKTKFA